VFGWLDPKIYPRRMAETRSGKVYILEIRSKPSPAWIVPKEALQLRRVYRVECGNVDDCGRRGSFAGPWNAHGDAPQEGGGAVWDLGH